MNEEIIKHLSTPGAIAVMMVWLHSRLNKVESRVDMLAGHLNAPQPHKRKASEMLRVWLPIAFALAFLTGCTITRKCTKAGCTTTIGVSTNAVPVLREVRKLVP